MGRSTVQRATGTPSRTPVAAPVRLAEAAPDIHLRECVIVLLRNAQLHEHALAIPAAINVAAVCPAGGVKHQVNPRVNDARESDRPRAGCPVRTFIAMALGLIPWFAQCDDSRFYASWSVYAIG